MWHWSREAAQLLVARDHVSFCRSSATSAAVPCVKSPMSSLASVEDAVASCLTEVQETTLAVDIVVSDVYVRFWIVVPPQNVSTRRDLRLCMLLRFEELFGESPDAWNFQADWSATKPFMACAVPLALTTAIRSAMSPHRFRIRRCVPRFVAEWNMHCWRFHQGDKWFGVSGDSTITIALVQGRQIAHVRKVRQQLDDEIHPDTIVSALRNLALHDETRSPEIVLLSGDVPETWHGTNIGGFRFELASGATPRVPLKESVGTNSGRAS